MRPLKLVMSAFGPYASVQTVDFRAATDAGLFGIYGPTGAGKSSIFSAMTFALFGQAAKEEQSIASLRSDHASPDLLTEVSLVFELGNRRYLVRRQPDQARPKARGEGETTHAHCAWLFDVTEVDFDSIDPSGCGVSLAEKKVSLVLERIRELLGYGAEQFRQIVLLPQGRFETFLTSNSNDRLKILRELFDVSLYRRLAETLKESAAAATAEVRGGRTVVGQRLTAEGFASSDELATGIQLASNEAASLATDLSAKEAELSAAAAKVSAGESLDARFRENEDARLALDALQQRAPAIESIRQRCKNAERARQACDIYNAISEAQLTIDQAVAVEADALTFANNAAEALSVAQADLARAKATEPDIELNQKRVTELERYKTILSGATDLLEDWQKSIAARDNLASSLEVASNDVSSLGERCEAADKASRLSRRNESRRTELRAHGQRLRTQLKEVKAYFEAGQAVDETEAQLVMGAAAVETSGAELADARAKEAICEQQFIAAQSAILAKSLIKGDPCPVCGSVEHPAPASSDDDPDDLESQLEVARARVADAAAKLQRNRETQAAIQTRLEERKNRLAALSRPTASLDEIESAISEHERAIEQLGEVTDPDELEKEFDSVKAQLVLERGRVDDLREQHRLAVTSEAVAGRSYRDAIDEVPEQYRDDATLDRILEEFAARVSELKQALADAQENLRVLSASHATAVETHRNAKLHRERSELGLSRARSKFAERLSELKLSEQDFHSFCDDIDNLDSFKRTIEEFQEQLRKAEGAVQQSETAIQGQQRPDLASLREARHVLSLNAAALRESAMQADLRHKFLQRLQTELSSELARLEALEQATGPLRALEEACSGKNEMNTTLETFAIGALFDEVLDIANLRLEPMTGGRYRFERDVESTGGRSKRGLDIRVHDVQTGRTRELSTLSGGETFIAALSLALGLSDVVEANHGGIRLDTVFVDEGFGSLDAEEDGGTLETVLQVLQNIVGESRAVGLISHVALVQQAVPNGFTIRKTLTGSSIETRAA